MRFTWDEEKRRANFLKHGLDFADAQLAAWSFAVIFNDDRFDYGEDREVAIVQLGARLVTVVYTLRGDAHRIISCARQIARRWSSTMAVSTRPLIDPDGEARELTPGEWPKVRRWQPGDPVSSLSPRQQEIVFLKGKAAWLREEAAALEAEAAALLVAEAQEKTPAR